MGEAIEVVRWVGLLTALLLTLIVLKEVFLVLRTLSDIRTLAERIRDAARGIAANAAPGTKLSRIEEPLRGFAESGRNLSGAFAELAARIEEIGAIRRSGGEEEGTRWRQPPV